MKKKRKAGRGAPGRAESRLSGGRVRSGDGPFARWEIVGLPTLGILALVGGWLAFLGALSNGHLNWNDFLESDTLRPWLKFRDLGQGGLFLGGWEKKLMAWVPDIALLWGMFALGADFRVAHLAFPLLLAALSAVGWILVCDFLFGKSPVRRAVVLLLHSLPMLAASRGELDVYYHHLVPLWRGGTLAMLPWLLWLALRAATARDGRESGIRLLALGTVVAAIVASDLIVLIWFVAPAIGAALALALIGAAKWRGTIRLVGALAVAAVVGRALENPAAFFASGQGGLPSRLDFAHFAAVGRVMVHLIGRVVERNPLEAVVCAAFVFVAVVRGVAALFAGRKRGGINLPPPFSVPEARGHLFAALFVPAAILVPLAMTLTSPQFGEQLDPGKFYSSSHRYFFTLFSFPLFVGWALLPWDGKFFGGRAASRVALAGACAAVLALSAPRAVSVSGTGLDPFATAFHKCFADNARKFGWTGGLAHVWAAFHLRANPDAGIGRVLPVSVRRGAAAEPEILFEPSVFNRHWFSGEFQFVAVNGFNGRVFHTTPSAAERGCPAARASECVYPGHFGGIVDDASVRAAFGEPSEVADCDGFGFYHYDPPLRFDFSGFERGELRGLSLARERRE